MVRINDDQLKEIKASYVAIRERFIEVQQREITKATAQQWIDDAKVLLDDMNTELVQTMRDAIEDLFELRSALERQHAAEKDANTTQIYLERQGVKQFVQNGRGLTTKLRAWAQVHKDDSGWHQDLIARLNELDGA